MGNLESPGGGGGTTGHRSMRSEFGVFPKPTGCGGTAGEVNPVIRKEERSANGGKKSGRKHHQNLGPVYKHGGP